MQPYIVILGAAESGIGAALLAIKQGADVFVSEKGESKEINVSKLSSGIYLAKFETANGTYTQKIIKQ